MNYQQYAFKKVDPYKMRVKLREEGEDFLLAYISILNMLADYHTNKLLVYKMIGDSALFEFLEAYSKNSELKVIILEFMVKTRVKRYQ